MPNDVRSRIAAAVRAEMARQQKTQDDLAELLGIVQPSVSLRLAGKRSFRGEELAALAEWLQVPVSTFLPAPAAERAA